MANYSIKHFMNLISHLCSKECKIVLFPSLKAPEYWSSRPLNKPPFLETG